MTFATRFEYDDAGRRVKTTHPDGQAITDHLDGASRLTAIDGVLDGLAYDGRGLLTNIDYKNGAATAFTYDARQRPSSIKTTAKSGKILYGVALSRDPVGNITSADDSADARDGRPTPRRPTNTTLGTASSARAWTRPEARPRC